MVTGWRSPGLEFRIEFPGNVAGEDEFAGLRIDGSHSRNSVFPRKIRDNHRVVQPFLGHSGQRSDVLRIGHERPLGRFGNFSANVIIELVGRFRPRGATTVYVQILEIPLTRCDLGQIGFPLAVLGLGETLNFSSAGEKRFRPIGGFINHWGICRAGVLRLEIHGLAKRIRARGDFHVNGFLQRSLGLEFAQGIPSAGQGGQWSIVVFLVRLFELARPCVVAVRRYIQRNGEKRSGSESQRESDQKCAASQMQWGVQHRENSLQGGWVF